MPGKEFDSHYYYLWGNMYRPLTSEEAAERRRDLAVEVIQSFVPLILDCLLLLDPCLCFWSRRVMRNQPSTVPPQILEGIAARDEEDDYETIPTPRHRVF